MAMSTAKPPTSDLGKHRQDDKAHRNGDDRWPGNSHSARLAPMSVFHRTHGWHERTFEHRYKAPTTASRGMGRPMR